MAFAVEQIFEWLIEAERLDVEQSIYRELNSPLVPIITSISLAEVQSRRLIQILGFLSFTFITVLIGEVEVDTGVLVAQMALRTLSSLTMVQFEATDFNGLPPPRTSNSVPHLSITKPSWVVRTESNVRKKRRKKPDPHCVVCEGSGRVDCYQCHGKGRTNNVDSEMLPKGAWPKWCRTCGGSGLDYCSRCLGTGEYRYIMGFHFMKKVEIQCQEKKS